MKKSDYLIQGFTLIEFIFVSFIMLMVICGIIEIYLMSTTVWMEGSAQITLQRKASTAMEKMVRGVGGSDGLREATDASCPSSTSVLYTSGIDDVQRRFYLSGNVLMYDPDTSISNNELSIVDCIRTTSSPQGIMFQTGYGIVTINLGMEGAVRDKKINVDLSTSVKLRN